MKKGNLINLLIVVLFSCAVVFGYLGWRAMKETDRSRTVTVAIMRDPLIENYDTNYYTRWLEEQTGYNIEFVFISKGYGEQYLKSLLLDTRGKVDAVFLPEDEEILSKKAFAEYVSGGYVCDLSVYAKESSNISALRGGGAFYYMPRMKNGKKDMNFGILWLNTHWLSRLSLKIPESFEELETVLRAFLENDPNGNGIADELPLVTNFGGSSIGFEDFVRYYMGNASASMEYCNRLRGIGLLSDACTGFSNRQMREVINASEECIGAFASKSISDYVYPNGSDVVSRYVAVPPLKDAAGGKSGQGSTPVDEIGGFIPENAVHKQEAFEIMDLMLSENASILATYGEKGVDYRDSAEGEISAYGNKAALTTINYLKYAVQNKNFRGAGPANLSQKMSDEVNWGGEGSYVEYMDARAVRLYETKQGE